MLLPLSAIVRRLVESVFVHVHMSCQCYIPLLSMYINRRCSPFQCKIILLSKILFYFFLHFLDTIFSHVVRTFTCTQN